MFYLKSNLKQLLRKFCHDNTATSKLTRTNRNFEFQALESRFLLSADPVIGVAQAAVIHDLLGQLDGGEVPGVDFLNGDYLHLQGESPSQEIQIGGTDTGNGTYIPNDQVEDLGGHQGLWVGQENGSSNIVLGDGQNPLNIGGDLILVNPAQGGEVHVQSDLNVQGDLVAYGSGHTQTLSADINIAGSSTWNDSVIVDGTHSITAAGTIQLGNSNAHTLNGNGGASDILTLNSGSHVTFSGDIGNSNALDGLSIVASGNVTFNGSIHVDGDINITTSGVVTFADNVVITGGHLNISNSSNIIFNSGAGLQVTGGGDVFLESNNLTINSGESTLQGTGKLTLRTTTLGIDMEIADPPLYDSAKFHLSNNEIASFADGFSKIILGHETGGVADVGSGAVRIGAINQAQQFSFRDALEVYGDSIHIEDYSNSSFTFYTNSNLKLDAVHNIQIDNQMESTGTLELHSALGSIAQIDHHGDGVIAEEIRFSSLTAKASTGINLAYVKSPTLDIVNIGDGDISVKAVSTAGDVNLTRLQQTSAAGTGNSLLEVQGGHLTIDSTGIDIAGSGNMTVLTTGSLKNISVQHSLSAQAGHIALTATGAIATTTGSTITANGTIQLNASGGNISTLANVTTNGAAISATASAMLNMSDGTTISSIDAVGDTGSISLTSGSTMSLSRIIADGNITLNSSANIIDNLTGEGENIGGGTTALTIQAATGIGSSSEDLDLNVASLALNLSTSGGAYLQEANDLSLLASGIVIGGSDGRLVLRTIDGSLTLNNTISNTGAIGHNLFQSQESIEANTSNIVLSANLTSSNGHLSLLSADNLQMTNGIITLSGTSATADLQADGTIVLNDGTQIVVQHSNLRLRSGSDMTITGLKSTLGNISLVSGGNIIDGGETHTDVTANGLRLEASGFIATALNVLEIDTTTTSLSLSSGGAFLSENSAVSLGSVSVNVERVAQDGTTSTLNDTAQSALSVSLNQTVSFVSSGDLHLTQALSALGTGHILLQSTSGSLFIENAVDAGTGSISLLASQNVEITANISTNAGSIDLQAGVDLKISAIINSQSGNMLLQSGSNMSLSNLQAGTGTIVLISGGNVSDAGDLNLDITAASLNISATGSWGTVENSIDVDVDVLAAVAGAGLYLNDSDNLGVAAIAASSLLRVAADGSTSTLTSARREDLNITGALSLYSTGNLTLAEGGSGNGDSVRATGIVYIGTAGEIELQAKLQTSSSLTLTAGGSINLNSTASIISDQSTIYIHSGNHLNMTDGSILKAESNIILDIANNITISSIQSVSGSLAIVAAGNLYDGDSSIDIQANELLLNIGGTIGNSSDALETSVVKLSARASELFLLETDDLILTNVSMSTSSSDSHLVSSNISKNQSDVLMSAGTLAIQLNGHLSVQDGSNSDGIGIVATGTKHILLQSHSGSINIQASVDANLGAISLLAATSLDVSAGLKSTGTMDLQASSSLQMTNGASAHTVNANIRISSGSALTLRQIDAGSASIWASSGASILGAGDENVDIKATSLSLLSTTDIGSNTQSLNLNINQLALNSGATAFIHNTNSLSINGVSSISVNRVQTDGSTSSINQSALDDVVTSGQLFIKADGDLSLNDGQDSDGNSISSNGKTLLFASGSLTVSSGISSNGNTLLSTSGSLTVASGVTTGGGHLNMVSTNNMTINNDISLTGSGTMNFISGGNLSAIVHLATAGGDAQLSSAGILSIGSINLGSGDLRLSATSIEDGDSTLDIVSVGLILNSSINVGSATDHLEIQVSNLSGVAGSSGFFVTETNDLTITKVTVNVYSVNEAGQAILDSNTLSDIEVITGHLVIQNNGTLTLADGDSDGIALSASGAGHIAIYNNSGFLNINSKIDAGTGSLSIQNASHINHGSSGDVVTSGAGNIDIRSGGNVLMSANATIQTDSGNIRYESTNSMSVAKIQSTSGSVSLISGAKIQDANGSTNNISAIGLRLDATQGVGIDEALEIDVSQLEAHAGSSGIWISEKNNVALGGLATITTTRVDVNANTSTISDSNWNIAIQSTTGFVDLSAQTITDGSDDGLDIQTLTLYINAGSVGFQNALETDIETLAATLTGSGLFLSETGNLSIGTAHLHADINMSNAASLAISVEGNLTVSDGIDVDGIGIASTGTGSIYLDAKNITLANDAALQTSTGDIWITATQNLQLGVISANNARVGLKAAQILDGDASTDITALGLLLDSPTIGATGDALDIEVKTLSATDQTSATFMINSTSDISFGTVNLNVLDHTSSSKTWSHGSLLSLTNSNIALDANSINMSGLNTTNSTLTLSAKTSIIISEITATKSNFTINATDINISKINATTSEFALNSTNLNISDLNVTDSNLTLKTTNIDIANLKTTNSNIILNATTSINIKGITAADSKITIDASNNNIASIMSTNTIFTLNATNTHFSELNTTNSNFNLNVTSIEIASMISSNSVLTMNATSAIISGTKTTDSNITLNATTSISTLGITASDSIYSVNANSINISNVDATNLTLNLVGATVALTGVMNFNNTGLFNLEASQSISMTTGSSVRSTGANLFFTSGGSMHLSQLNSTGTIVLQATGNVTDNLNPTAPSITANKLLIDVLGMGSYDNLFETNVDILWGNVGSNGLFLQETDQIQLGSTTQNKASDLLNNNAILGLTLNGNSLLRATGDILVAQNSGALNSASLIMEGSNLNLSNGVKLSTVNGLLSINVTALNLGSGQLQSSGNISIIADSILQDQTAIHSQGLALQVKNLGSNSTPFSIDTNIVSVSSSGSGVYLIDANTLEIGTVDARWNTQSNGASTTIGNLYSGAQMTGGSILKITSGSDLKQTANIESQGSAITIINQSGSINMSPGTSTQSHGGPIIYSASSDLSIGQLNAALGSVSLTAAGVISDANQDGNTNVTAASLDIYGKGPSSSESSASGARAALGAAAIETQVDRIYLDAVTQGQGNLLLDSRGSNLGILSQPNEQWSVLFVQNTQPSITSSAGLLSDGSSVVVESQAHWEINLTLDFERLNRIDRGPVEQFHLDFMGTTSESPLDESVFRFNPEFRKVENIELFGSILFASWDGSYAKSPFLSEENEWDFQLWSEDLVL